MKQLVADMVKLGYTCEGDDYGYRVSHGERWIALRPFRVGSTEFFTSEGGDGVFADRCYKEDEVDVYFQHVLEGWSWDEYVLGGIDDV